MIRSFPSEIWMGVRLMLVFGTITMLYSLGITGVGQLAFNHAANGSLIEKNGTVVGSELIGQWFDPTDARYFHPRPSATVDPNTGQALPYAANNSAGSNLGPSNQNLINRVRAQVAEIIASEYNVPADGVPADMVTTDFSGLDPHISVANARIQAVRVAKVRGLSLDRVNAVVDKYTQGRYLWVFGEPAVNVLELNLALDNGEI